MYRNKEKEKIRLEKRRKLLEEKPSLAGLELVHINKTGGTSIEKALCLPLNHHTALKKIKTMGRAEWDKLITFTVIRNPWAKALSHYNYRKKRFSLRKRPIVGEPAISFADWLIKCYVEKDPDFLNKEKMFMPQVDWIRDSDGNICVKEILRQENLQQEFYQLTARLGDPITLDSYKTSSHGHYSEQYDDRSRDIIADAFKEDISLFGYQFEK